MNDKRFLALVGALEAPDSESVRCEKCKHWQRDPAVPKIDPYGFCGRIVDASRDGAQLRKEGGDLATMPDFGCALFEVKS